MRAHTFKLVLSSTLLDSINKSLEPLPMTLDGKPLEPEEAPLKMYTVYKHPTDHPTKFVVRPFRIHPTGGIEPEEVHSLTDTLKQARASLPKGLTNIGRNPKDHPTVVEVWI